MQDLKSDDDDDDEELMYKHRSDAGREYGPEMMLQTLQATRVVRGRYVCFDST